MKFLPQAPQRAANVAGIFGLQSNGRTKIILLSMLPLLEWRYDRHS